jgi:hypothetical protein
VYKLARKVCIVVDHHQKILPLSPNCELSCSTLEITCNPFFLSIAPVPQLFGVVRLSLKDFQVLNTLLELLLDCKHMFKSVVEMKINTFLGPRL